MEDCYIVGEAEGMFLNNEKSLGTSFSTRSPLETVFSTTGGKPSEDMVLNDR